MRIEDPHRPYVDDVGFPCPQCTGAHAARARGHRRVVRLRRDAVRPGARAVRERGPLRAPLPGGLHLRGARPDARLVLLAARRLDAAVRSRAVRERRLPRPHPRRAGPEDVEVAGQHRRAVGRARPLRRRRLPLVLLHLQAAVGRLPLLASRRSARACGSSSSSCGTPTRSSSCTRTRRRHRTQPVSDGGETELDRWMLSRLAATVEEVTERLDALRRDHGRPRDRGVRRRPLQLVRAPLAPALLGRRPDRVRDAARVPAHGGEAARAVHAVRRRRDLRQPRRQRAVGPPLRLAGAAHARPRARGRDGDRARDGAPRPRARAARRRSRSASRCARRSWSPRGREREAIERLADIVRDELNVKELRFVDEADELGSYEVKPNYRTLGPRFGKNMPQVAAAVAALDAEHVAGALREGARSA